MQLKVYRQVCDYYNNTSEYDSLLKYSLEGLTKARQIKSAYWEISLLNITGIGYWNVGDYDKAILHYKQGLQKVEETGLKSYLSNLYNNMGLAYWNKSDLPKALDLYIKSLDIDIKKGNKEGMSSSMLNIGLVHSDMGNYTSALEYYQKSLPLCVELGDVNGEVNNYINIGLVYEKLADYDRSMEYGLKALKLCQKIDDKKLLALTYNNLGSLHSIKKLHELAITYYELSLQNYIACGDVAEQAMVQNNIAEAYVSLKKYDLAIPILNKALEKEKELDLKSYEIRTHYILAEAYANLKDYKKAYENQVLYNGLNDTVNNLKNAGLINQMQKDVEMKAQEATLTIQKEKELALKEAEKQKQSYFILMVIIVLSLTLVFTFFLYKRFKLTSSQKEIIEKQKHLVEEKQTEILDSIHYAKRIQNVLIANSKFISEHLPENFIYFDPKDIVSGDFYWAALHHNKFYLAICDSTGHGVPGAFMSLLNMGFLNEAIKEKNIEKPNEILDYVRDRLVNSISAEGQKDGMDCILLCYDKKKNTYEYAAANNEPILIRNGAIIELAKDKMPVGKGESADKFTLHHLDLQKGDGLYMYTDGFADQFGGPKGKKFMYKRLNELLLSLNDKPIKDHKPVLEETFKTWKGGLEQVDDVLVAGIKI